MPDNDPAAAVPPTREGEVTGEVHRPDSGQIRTAMRARWQEPPDSQLTERRTELRRVADAVRTIVERLGDTNAATDIIADAADELERVAASFKRLGSGRDYVGFAEAANAGGERFASFEHSPFIGRANPLAPPLVFSDMGDAVEGRVIFGSAYEGPPGCVHGGYVAGAFDEVLGAAQSLSGLPAMTGTLTVRYRSPTPLHTELRFVGEYLGVEGRKIFTRGRLFAGDRLCAEAEGVFVSVNLDRFLALMAERDDRARNHRD